MDLRVFPSVVLPTALAVLGVHTALEQPYEAGPVTVVPDHVLDLRLLALLHVFQLRLYATERDPALLREPENHRLLALFFYGRLHAETLSLGIHERNEAEQYLLGRLVPGLLLRCATALLLRPVLILFRSLSAILLRPAPRLVATTAARKESDYQDDHGQKERRG